MNVFTIAYEAILVFSSKIYIFVLIYISFSNFTNCSIKVKFSAFVLKLLLVRHMVFVISAIRRIFV